MPGQKGMDIASFQVENAVNPLIFFRSPRDCFDIFLVPFSTQYSRGEVPLENSSGSKKINDSKTFV